MRELTILRVSAFWGFLIVLIGPDAFAIGTPSAGTARKVDEIHVANEVSCLTFSADGRLLAGVEWTGSNVHVWQVDSRVEQRLLLSIPEGAAFFTPQAGLRFSPDGRLLALARTQHRDAQQRERQDNGVVRIWNVASGTLMHEISENVPGLRGGSVEFTPDGRFLVRTYDRHPSDSGDQFLVHDTDTWKEVWGLRMESLRAELMSLSPDGAWAAVAGPAAQGAGSELAIVDMRRRIVARRVTNLPQTGLTRALQWSASGTRVAMGFVASGNGVGKPTFVMVEASTGEIVPTTSLPRLGINSVAFTSDGKYLLESGERDPVRLWDASHTKLVQEIPIMHAQVAAPKRGQHTAIVSLNTVSIWDVK